MFTVLVSSITCNTSWIKNNRHETCTCKESMKYETWNLELDDEIRHYTDAFRSFLKDVIGTIMDNDGIRKLFVQLLMRLKNSGNKHQQCYYATTITLLLYMIQRRKTRMRPCWHLFRAQEPPKQSAFQTEVLFTTNQFPPV